MFCKTNIKIFFESIYIMSSKLKHNVKLIKFDPPCLLETQVPKRIQNLSSITTNQITTVQWHQRVMKKNRAFDRMFNKQVVSTIKKIIFAHKK